MEPDRVDLMEKILKDLQHVLSTKLELTSFEIIPAEANLENKSPVHYNETSLGLDSWCVKLVYMHCYKEVMTYIENCIRKSSRPNFIDTERIVKLLNIALLLNPELSAFWNKRRILVMAGCLDWYIEIRYSRIVLSRKPKSYDAFSYRRWLFDRMFSNIAGAEVSLDEIVSEELLVCQLASEKTPNNYHSWNHRIWLVKKLERIYKPTDVHILFVEEFDFSEQWISKNVSDHSGFHYRQFCIVNLAKSISDENWMLIQTTLGIDFHKLFTSFVLTNITDASSHLKEIDLNSYSDSSLIDLLLGDSLLDCSCVKNKTRMCKQFKVLFRELVMNTDSINFYTHHESLWYHRRFIVHEILRLLYKCFGLVRKGRELVAFVCNCIDQSSEKQTKMLKYDSNCVYSSLLFKVIIAFERKLICYQAKVDETNTAKYEKYLRFVEALNTIL